MFPCYLKLFIGQKRVKKTFYNKSFMFALSFAYFFWRVEILPCFSGTYLYRLCPYCQSHDGLSGDYHECFEPIQQMEFSAADHMWLLLVPVIFGWNCNFPMHWDCRFSWHLNRQSAKRNKDSMVNKSGCVRPSKCNSHNTSSSLHWWDLYARTHER